MAWQNSLVFHSMDKVTSFAIHILPATFYYLIRWHPALSKDYQPTKISPISWSENFLYPLAFYLSWQVIYLIVHFLVIEKDPTLVTSMRHLVKDKKNPSHKFGKKWAINLGKL